MLIVIIHSRLCDPSNGGCEPKIDVVIEDIHILIDYLPCPNAYVEGPFGDRLLVTIDLQFINEEESHLEITWKANLLYNGMRYPLTLKCPNDEMKLRIHGEPEITIGMTWSLSLIWRKSPEIIPDSFTQVELQIFHNEKEISKAVSKEVKVGVIAC